MQSLARFSTKIGLENKIYCALLLVNGYKAGVGDSVSIVAGTIIAQLASIFTMVFLGELEKKKDASFDTDNLLPSSVESLMVSTFIPPMFLCSQSFGYTELNKKQLLLYPSFFSMTLVVISHLYQKCKSKMQNVNLSLAYMVTPES